MGNSIAPFISLQRSHLLRPLPLTVPQQPATSPAQRISVFMAIFIANSNSATYRGQILFCLPCGMCRQRRSHERPKPSIVLVMNRADHIFALVMSVRHQCIRHFCGRCLVEARAHRYVKLSGFPLDLLQRRFWRCRV